MKSTEKKPKIKDIVPSMVLSRNELVGFVALSINNEIIAIESTPERAYSTAVIHGIESPRVLQYEYFEED